MSILLKFVFLTVFLMTQLSGFGQKDTIAVKSIEGITDKMLELISGDIGEERDWEEYRQLFLPTAQKISIRQLKDGTSRSRSMNLEEFIRNVGPLYARDGFEEYKIGLTINEFNGIANVFQSFYCKNLIGTYEQRGVNSYQLVYMEDRWWIASTMFTNESETLKLPNELLFSEYQLN